MHANVRIVFSVGSSSSMAGSTIGSTMNSIFLTSSVVHQNTTTSRISDLRRILPASRSCTHPRLDVVHPKSPNHRGDTDPGEDRQCTPFPSPPFHYMSQQGLHVAVIGCKLIIHWYIHNAPTFEAIRWTFVGVQFTQYICPFVMTQIPEGIHNVLHFPSPPFPA
jgi:hypothetical protein